MKSYYDPGKHIFYQRLEGRPREDEMDDALAARIHDPLWMLARQYQFGEFQGEDAGSAISAKVAINSSQLRDFRTGDMEFRAMDLSTPLETTVERLTPCFDHKMSLRMGRKFLELLISEGSQTENWPEDGYKGALIDRFPFGIPSLEYEELDHGKLAAQARAKTLREATIFIKAIHGKAINGAAIWDLVQDQPDDPENWVNTSENTDGFVEPDHINVFLEAVSKWIDWVNETWNIPPANEPSCWKQEKMEYDFDVSVDEGNGETTVLHAEGYHHGHLDWFAFDVRTSGSPVFSKGPSETKNVRREVKAIIPAQAYFAGMPNARWWELEDCRVDIGNFQPTGRDVAAMLALQFALYYSNDWLMIPYDIPVGSMVEVEGIVVTDTFGYRTLVKAAHETSGDSWQDWTMYSLTKTPAGGGEANGIEQRGFVAPSAVKVLESEPIEKVRFIRDEMANMVWGIESIVPNMMGGGIDGYECAAAMDNIYRMLEDLQKEEVADSLILANDNDSVDLHRAKTTKPQLKYTLGTTVTENWIPFIPVHIPRSNRQMRLQRASMPRISEIMPAHQVRPRTPLLRQGIGPNDNQIDPLYINEEEVPRAGATVIGTYQRTRWYNGKIALWYGRRKTTGRGEGSSGLRFDHLSDNF